MSDELSKITSQPNGEFDDDEMNLVELLETIWQGRKTIVSVTGLFTAIAVLIALIMPNKYSASVTILPETESRGMGQLAQFAGLASLAGVNLGAVSEVQLYPAIIKSDRVLRDVIYRQYETARFDHPVNLIEYWEFDEDSPEENFEKAFKKLRENVVSVSVARDTRLVTLSVETEEPKLSADIANAIADRLDQFMVSHRRTKASEQRQWIEDRMKEVEVQLAASEEALREFREANRRILDSPALMLQEGRLMRDVEVNNAIYVELKKQLEATKIQEIRDMPIIQVLDYARIPIEKSGPNRRMIVLIAFVVGGMISVAMVFVSKIINSSEESQSFFRRITTDVRNDLGFRKKAASVEQ